MTHILGLGSTRIHLETASIVAEDCRLVYPLSNADIDTQLDMDYSIITEVPHTYSRQLQAHRLLTLFGCTLP